jgi:PAS domain S-box-containing protein
MNRRILVIDDQQEILEDYRQILTRDLGGQNPELKSLERELFGEATAPRVPAAPRYELATAHQGEEGFHLVEQARAEGRPFAVAFVDMRMPPGWDGMETARRIREKDAELEIVIVTAYSDHDREKIVWTVGAPSKLLYLKKPFDVEEIRQLALALTEKWNLSRQEERQRELLKDLLLKISQVKNLGLRDLRAILEVTLGQMASLAEAEHGFVASIVQGQLAFRAGIGRFAGPESLEGPALEDLRQEILARTNPAEIVWVRKFEVVPFYVVEYDRTVLILENPQAEAVEKELIRLFMENVSAAVDAACLYERLFQSHRDLERVNQLLTHAQKDLERKILERTEELVRLNELHRGIIENAGLAILTFDAEGRISSANRGVERILGWKPEELQGQPLRILCPQEKEACLEKLKQSLTGSQPLEVEHELARQDGKTFPAHITLTAINGEAGSGPSHIILIADLTERKNLERQLLQSQKMESLGILAGGVAHNFNNLLAVILSSADELRERLGQEPELRENLEMILNSSQRAAGLVRQLLSFSRQDSGAKTSLPVKQLIEEVVSLLGKVLHKNIQMECEVEADLPAVAGDFNQLEQVLMNLCINARDAMPHGGVLRLQAARAGRKSPDPLRPEEDFIRLSVSDTGVGMPPEVQEHLFEPFYSTKEVGQGTGLGLATAYGIVAAHGGRIEVASQPGQGTTMSIYLPGSKEVPELKAPEAATPQGPAHGKVLVIEDEEPIRRLTQAKLTRLGYEVVLAADGQEGLRKLEEHPDLNLVVMDMIMPGVSGRELFLKMRQLRPELPILLMSGYTKGDEAEELLAIGASGYLQKPFHLDVLAEKVQATLH